MQRILTILSGSPTAARRGAAIITALDPRRAVQGAALAILIYAELVAIGIALGGGQ